MTVGTIFTGCDVVHHVLQSLAWAWMVMYNISFTFSMSFGCEKNEDKQRFLLREFPTMKRLFRDAVDLASTYAHDVKSGTMQLVPTVMLLIAGIVCASKRP